MSFAPIRLSLPWLLGPAGAPEQQGRTIAISHGAEVIDGLLWCEATDVIEPNIRDICLYLLLKALSSTDDAAERRRALTHLIKNATLASRTRVPMAILKQAAAMEQVSEKELKEQVDSWRNNPYDTPRFVSTILHPAIVSLLVPDTQDTAERDDRTRVLISVLLKMFYHEQINEAGAKPYDLDSLVLDIDELLWNQKLTAYQTAKALSIILRDKRLPPASNWSARLDVQRDATPPGYIGGLLETLYLHDIVLPLSRRVIALYSGPVMTKRSELWALTLHVADILRDSKSYGQTRESHAAAWTDELEAVIIGLRESPHDLHLLAQNLEDPRSGKSLREHLVWAFMTAVADDYILITKPPRDGR